MIRKLLGYVCPHCIQDDELLSEHPAMKANAQTMTMLDRIMEQITAPRKEHGPSGHAARDMLTGEYGQDELR